MSEQLYNTQALVERKIELHQILLPFCSQTFVPSTGRENKLRPGSIYLGETAPPEFQMYDSLRILQCWTATSLNVSQRLSLFISLFIKCDCDLAGFQSSNAGLNRMVALEVDRSKHFHHLGMAGHAEWERGRVVKITLHLTVMCV